MNKTEKLKAYSDGRLFIEYPSHMKLKCHKKGGSYNLKIDSGFFISIAFFSSDCMEDLIRQATNCRTYDGGMTRITYLGEMFFRDNAAIVSMVMHHKMDGTFIGKNYGVIITSVKSHCIVIEITGVREFDIKDFSEILGSIRVAE